MAKFKNVFKVFIRTAMIIGYLSLIVVLVWQALTPGHQSSDISSSVGDKLNEVVTEIKKPVVEIVNVESISISSVTVDGKKYSENITLSISQSGTVNCKVAPENATNQSLNYRSSDEQILTVYATGKIVGKSEGTASVIVSAAENEEITAEITVNVVKVLATKIQIDNIPKELRVGESHKLGALFTPKNASDRSVKWTSSNTSVVSVNSSGSLSAKKEGTATITVTSTTNPSLTASVTITVLPKIEKPILPVSSIKISAKSTVGYIGSTLKLSAKLSPSGSIGKVEWYSADEEIATITQSGVVTCLLAGKVTITAKCGENITDSITITVKEVISKTITLEAWNLTATDNGYLLKQGKAAKIFATLDIKIFFPKTNFICFKSFNKSNKSKLTSFATFIKRL